MRVVLDTNILVRAQAGRGGPAEAVLHAITEDRNHRLIISPYLLDEIESVLLSDRLQLLWDVTAEEISLYRLQLADAGDLVIPVGGAVYVPGDPKDNPILQLAIAGKADVLCTRDRDFEHERVAESCRLHGLRVMDDVALLEELRQSRS